MTQIHGNVPPRERLDDSTVRQRRLLQDLERQWLDTWGQAHQVQPPASFSLETSNAVADAGALIQGGMSATKSSPALPLMPLHAGRPDGFIALAPRGGDDAEASAGGAIADAVLSAGKPTSKPLATSGAADSRTREAGFESLQPGTRLMSNLSPEPGSIQTAMSDVHGKRLGMPVAADTQVRMREALGSSADSNDPTADLQNRQSDVTAGASVGKSSGMPLSDSVAGPVAGISAVVSTSLRPTAGDPGVQQVGITMGVAQVGSGRGSASVAYPAPLSPTPSAAGVATFPEPESRLGFNQERADLPSSAGSDEEATTTRTRRQFSPVKQRGEPAPLHLMLRELDDREVLASMRDAQLGPHESQAAAQGLARALMQAGYARVQVVVNGHQRTHGDPPMESSATGDGDRADNASQPNASIQPTRHGH